MESAQVRMFVYVCTVDDPSTQAARIDFSPMDIREFSYRMMHTCTMYMFINNRVYSLCWINMWIDCGQKPSTSTIVQRQERSCSFNPDLALWPL